MKKKYVKDVEDELLDLVDAEGSVIGTIMRSQVNKQTAAYIRCVIAIISDHQGKLLVAPRALHKKWMPGALSFVGGCVRSGETYEQALKRELDEELTLDVSIHNYSFLCEFSPQADLFGAYTGVFRVKLQADPEIIYNEDDFLDVNWLYPEQIYDKLKNGTEACKAFPVLLNHFFPRP